MKILTVADLIHALEKADPKSEIAIKAGKDVYVLSHVVVCVKDEGVILVAKELEAK